MATQEQIQKELDRVRNEASSLADTRMALLIKTCNSRNVEMPLPMIEVLKNMYIEGFLTGVNWTSEELMKKLLFAVEQKGEYN
jgi:hypothetical protein